jgi:hypothetical protein
MAQLAGDLQAAVAELRREPPRTPSLPADLSPFPLDSVMRIHEGLRRSDAVDPRSPDAQVPAAGSAVASSGTTLQLPAASAELAERMESLERAVTSGQEDARAATVQSEGMRRAWRAAMVVAVLGAIGVTVLVWWLQRRVEARLNEAADRVAAAERQAAAASQLANQRIAETQEEADRRVAEARETALRAEIVSGVLAAPDLIRFSLAGGPTAPRADAQVLWSRSRGLVLSASRLPAPRQGATYQLWLMTSGAPVSAGVFTPDSAGRATLASANPPNIPRPVLSAVVTLEPSGGRPRPTGDMVLTRAQ